MHQLYETRFLDLCIHNDSTEIMENFIKTTYKSYDSSYWCFLLKTSIDFSNKEYLNILTKYDIINHIDNDDKRILILDYIKKSNFIALDTLLEDKLNFHIPLLYCNMLNISFMANSINDSVFNYLLYKFPLEYKLDFTDKILNYTEINDKLEFNNHTLSKKINCFIDSIINANDQEARQIINRISSFCYLENESEDIKLNKDFFLTKLNPLILSLNIKNTYPNKLLNINKSKI